jgi:hypothetical protein
MPEKDNKFHEFALKSILFKGQVDLYVGYLKAEKIAHVLSLLQARSSNDVSEKLNSAVSAASRLPETIAHYAAGEMDITIILADIFGLLTALRLLATQQYLAKENSAILVQEYEALAERISGGTRLSPFIQTEDFLLPSLPQSDSGLQLSMPARESAPQFSVKDTKGHSRAVKDTEQNSKGQTKRTEAILEVVRRQKQVSIKDIAKVVKGYSEKTIQRELALLIQMGLVEKHGERRWSVYSPT